jgi:hypothetical protein
VAYQYKSVHGRKWGDLKGLAAARAVRDQGAF